jgi:hypothetical protein
MKSLSLAMIATIMCSLLLGFMPKMAVSEGNCIVIDDICCLMECGGGAAARFAFRKTTSGELPIGVTIKNRKSTKVTVTVRNSATDSIVINQNINLTPRRALTTSINMSALQKNTKYKMSAQFLYTDNTTFTTPVVPVTVK